MQNQNESADLYSAFCILTSAFPAQANPTQEDVFKSIQSNVNDQVDGRKVLAFFAAAAGLVVKRLGAKDSLTKLAFFWLALIILQVALGVATIWTNKAADVATAHVMVGALSLVTGALWCLISFGRSAKLPETETAPFGAFGTLAANKP